MTDRESGQVIVFGATGFIGRAVCDILRSRATAFAGLGRTAFVTGESDMATPLSPSAWEDIVASSAPLGVIFVAGPAVTTTSPAELAEGHLGLLRRALDLSARGRAATTFVYASSGLVYGPQPSARPVPETGPLRPATAYAKVKRDCEELVAAASASGRIDGRVARLFNVAGPGQRAGIVADIVEQLAAPAARQESITLRSDSPILDITDVRDTAAGIVALLDASTAPPAVNICSGSAVTTSDLVTAASKAVGHPLAVLYHREAGPREALIGDSGLMQATTGWRPRYRLATTIADAIGARCGGRESR